MTRSIKYWLVSGVRALLGTATCCMVLAIGMLPGRAAGEVTGYYIGNSDHKLGEINNWKDGIRPGRFIDDGVTNGTFGGTMIFDDNATGWGVNLFTHNPAMVSVSNMVFRGGGLAKDFLVPDYQTLWLEPGGRLEIEADSEKTLTFGNATFLKIRDAANEGEYVDIVNHSTVHPLRIGSVGNTQVSTSPLKPEFRFSGEGDIVLAYSYTPNGFSPAANGSAVVFVFNQTGTFKHEGQHDTYADAIVVPASDTFRRIELNTKGFRLRREGVCLDIGADTVITGPQCLDFGQYNYNQSKINVAAGKTLTLDMGKLTTSYGGGNLKGICFTGGGTTVFTERVTNTAEKVYIEGSAIVKSPVVGAAGSISSPMGAGDGISLAWGTFVYTGAGETTDRGFEMRYASTAWLEHAGTGPLVIAGDFGTPGSGSSTLRLVNGTDQEATYSGLLADNASGTLAVAKQGGGLWRIDCAATYTGATTVEGGTLALGPSGSIASSALALKGGCLRIENASAACASVTLAQGTANVLAVADGVSCAIPAIVRNDGATLDVALGEGSRLTVAGLSDGSAPAWLTINGKSAFVSDGKLSDVSVEIDAKGGVIPDSPSAVVGITTASGQGASVSLESTSTTVAAVNQKQSAADAEIALKAGETLNVAQILVSDGASGLTISANHGAATLQGIGGNPVVLDPAAGTTLGLAGGLTVPSAEIGGEGTVFLGEGVDLSNLTTSGSPAIETESGSNLEIETWTNCNASAAYSGAGALTVSELAIGGAGTADSSLTIAGGTITNRTGVFKSGSGYLRLVGGSFVEKAEHSLDSLVWGASPCQITFEQTGGEYRNTGTAALGHWNTQLDVYLSGGESVFGDVSFPAWNAGISGDYYTAGGNRLNYVLTVDGDGSLTMGTITMGRIGADYQDGGNEWANPSIVNLNGGVCTVGMFVRDAAYSRSGRPSSRAFVNFNGGTLKTANTSGAFGSGSAAIDRVTVFVGGATLDTDGRNIASDMPISAPNGKGVVSVPVPTEVLSKTFAAPPTVAIIGDGEGASARVLFNPTTGKVTGVQVLSPGWGYTSAKARFNHGGYTCIGESTVELDDVECGQLVKAGTGVYTFNAANSVTKLKVAGGSVKSGVNNTFPAATALTLDGGNYDMNGHSQTFGSVSFGASGGTILNGTAAAGNLVCDFAAALAGNPGVADLSNVSFAAGAKTLITGYDPDELETRESVLLLRFASGAVPASVPPLDESVELPKGWVLQMTQAGLKLSRQNGLVLIFR